LIVHTLVGMAGKITSGSSASLPGARPRAQISYEGEDEFSTMSLDPARKDALKEKQRLAPAAPGEREQVKVDELKPTNDNGIVSLLRRIFAK
jgi:hypothetical protein